MIQVVPRRRVIGLLYSTLSIANMLLCLWIMTDGLTAPHDREFCLLRQQWNMLCDVNLAG